MYEYSVLRNMDKDESMKELDEYGMKMAMVDHWQQLMTSSHPTPENVAFKRYADECYHASDEDRFTLRHPKGEKLRRSVGGDLLKF